MVLTNRHFVLSYLLILYSLSLQSQPRINNLIGITSDSTINNCGCPSTSSPVVIYKKEPDKIFVDEGIVRYSQRKSIILEPKLKEELFLVESPVVFLQNLTIKDEEPTLVVNTIKTYTTYEADPRLERVLKVKPIEDVGVKVYKRRDSGLRGLEAIKSFQKQNRVIEVFEDTDKFVGDRIDNIGKIKNNNN
ncbi:MAG: hypothetical protein EBS19_11330 [Spirochaetia bacterium]|nr:hypothetical protein [Spirochaetia bacterium]